MTNSVKFPHAEKEYLFHHPLAFWSGCLLITFGVLSHIPMFAHAAHMGYRMVGMPMSTTMLVGMALIPLGLLFACYGLMPRLAALRQDNSTDIIHFHVADSQPLNKEHLKLVFALLVAVIVDVMKPATLGFVMPGMTEEYQIGGETVGSLAFIALTGTALGSVLWGKLADSLGRRAAIMLSALMFIGTSICGAMPVFEWNLVMCFLMGLSAGGLLPITFTLMAEMIPAQHRGWLLVALGGVGATVGYLLASGAAAILEPIFSWRILWMLGLPTGIAVIVLNRYIPESPRFLANVGLWKQAKAVLRKYNGELDSVDDHAGIEVHAGIEEHASVEEGSGELSQHAEQAMERQGLYQTLSGTYGRITLGLVGTGVAWGIVNFGFLLWLPTILGEKGLSAETSNALLAQSGLFAIPGILFVVWLYHHWSSVKSLALFVALTAVSLILFAMADFTGAVTARTIVISTAVLLVSSSGVIAMLIPYAAEIYPAHHRGVGSGLIAASTKMGGIAGALLGVGGLFQHMGFAAVVLALPMLLFAILLLRSGIDTRGKRLEDINAAFIAKTGMAKSGGAKSGGARSGSAKSGSAKSGDADTGTNKMK